MAKYKYYNEMESDIIMIVIVLIDWTKLLGNFRKDCPSDHISDVRYKSCALNSSASFLK